MILADLFTHNIILIVGLNLFQLGLPCCRHKAIQFLFLVVLSSQLIMQNDISLSYTSENSIPQLEDVSNYLKGEIMRIHAPQALLN